MFRSSGFLVGAAAAVAVSLAPGLAPGFAPKARAQSSGSGWFVPKSQAPAPAAQGRRQVAAPASAPQFDPGAAGDQSDPQQAAADQSQTPPVLPLPPIPALTAIAKGAAPPTAVVGVLSVQDVMRNSTAAQQIERVLGARRDKLNQEAQKEQASWRDLQQQIQNSKGSPDQLQTRERALQQRVLKAQRGFRNRNRILQEAAQVSLGQVQRELVQIIRAVAASHGMNLVLHREQVALNISEFDITAQVASQLNSTLSSVFIPGDGVDPEELARSGSFPTTADPGPQADNNAAGANPAQASATKAPGTKAAAVAPKH